MIQEQNLIRSFSKTDKPVLPPGFYQQIILNVLTVLAALATGYTAARYIQGTGGMLALILTLAAFCIFSALETLLIPSILRRALLIVAEVGALLVFFLAHSLSMLLGVGIVLYIFLLWGELAGRTIARNNLEVHFFRTARVHIGRITTAILLLLILFYLPVLNEAGHVFISPNTFQSLYNSALQISTKIYPEIRLDSSLETLARSVARYQLNSNRNFRILPFSEQEAALAEISKQIIFGFTAYAKDNGLDIAPATRVSSILYQFINSTLTRWHQTYGNWFVGAWAIALFLLVRGIGILFAWVVSLIGFFLYHLLLALDILKIGGISRVQETVQFS